MPPIEVPELASGNPQLQRALTKIAKAEAKGLEKFDTKLSKVDNKIELVKDFKARFAEVKESVKPFRTPNDFRELKGMSSMPDILSVSSVDKNLAVPGTYDIEVLQLANTDSVMTHGFADRDNIEVGVGYFRFFTPEGEQRDVYINSDNNTLDGMAKAINQAGIGVRAQVVHDGTDGAEPWRLIITSDGTGWKNDNEWPEFYMIDGDSGLDLYRQRDAKSAIVKFNGMPLMLDENKMKEVLPGVSLDLNKAVPGSIVKLEIQPDYEKIREKAQNFVTKLNGVLQFIQDQNKLGPDSRTDPKKAMGGDVSLQSIESRLRTVIQDTQNQMSSAQVAALRDVGIVFNRNGTLDFDSNKFQTKLENNFDEVAAFFTGTSPMSGFAYQVSQLVDGVARTGDGMASLRENTLMTEKKRLENDRARAETRAQNRIEKAKNQFARLEGALQQMQAFQQSGGVGAMTGAPIVT